MRDLRRRNANVLAYQQLEKDGFEVFTPTTEMILTIGGKRQRRVVPVIQDLLFVHECKSVLDPYVEKNANLQYRYQFGKSIKNPIIVRDDDMQRFIHAVTHSDNTRYYMPGEIVRSMYGKQVRIVGGTLDGYEGKLLSVRGSKYRRLILEIPDIVIAAIEVEPEFIQFV